MEIIGGQVKRLTQSPASWLGVGLVVGPATALWSTNVAIKAMFSASNVVRGEKEGRAFVTLTATSLAFTGGSRRRVAEIRYLPRRDAQGAVDGFYVFVLDITQRVEAAERLVAVNSRLEDQVLE